MLLHVGFGNVRRLSILRDTRADITGHTPQKINAAYAFGGPPLMIDTVENFLGNGVEINHLIEVNFKQFPRFIDSLGGVTVDNKSELKAPFFDAAVRAPAECAPGNGGANGQPPTEGFRMQKGSCHLNGAQALTFARIRKNLADPGESDAERAARQQAVLSGIRGQLTTPGTFIRLPWIAWAAPTTVRTDLRGLGMTLLAVDLLTGGAGKTDVLGDAANVVPGTTDIAVSDVEKTDAIHKLLGD
jgi:LCP family protein required for cell wall assembly